MASGEHFTQGLKPELWSSLSSIIEGLGGFQEPGKENSARSSHSNKQAQEVLENFVPLHRNQHHCLRSGKTVEDSPELTYTEGSSRSPLATEGLWLHLHEHVMDAHHESLVERGVTAHSLAGIPSR